MAWKKGESGNRKGRPRSGKSLAEAIRRTVDPEEMVRKLLEIAETSPSDQTKLRAIEILMERGWKKPAQVLEVGPADPYEDLTEEELAVLEAETLAEIEAIEARALPAANEAHALPAAAAESGLSDASGEACAPSPAAPTSELRTTRLLAGVLVRRAARRGEEDEVAELVEENGESST